MKTTTLAPAAGLCVPELPHPDAIRLAETEYGRIAETIAAIDDDEWTGPTDCTDWNVHDLVAHVVGMASMAASPLENVRQQRLAGKRSGGESALVDALTAVQVRRFGRYSNSELVRLAAAMGSRATRGRRRIPSLIRRRTMPGSQVVNSVDERWSIGYLTDTILTRDPWMHRIDLCRATGTELILTPEHDGTIVDDVVREWAGRHGRPHRLTLTGPAGGTWSAGEASGENLTLDAVEFCRILSGRGRGDGLLATEVPF